MTEKFRWVGGTNILYYVNNIYLHKYKCHYVPFNYYILNHELKKICRAQCTNKIRFLS